MTRHNTSSGFALLMTLLVVSVVVSITLAVIELSIKQLNLSVSAKDSEIAFHAANAGMECIRYALRTEETDFAGSGNVTASCFNRNITIEREPLSPLEVSGGPANRVARYSAEITWPTGDRCSQMDIVRADVPVSDDEWVRVNYLSRVFSGRAGSKSCTPGSTCVIAEVVGYNKRCADITDPGTVRREILLEF